MPARVPAVRFMDAIRFVANPYERHLAHITVRGPYGRALSAQEEKRLATLVAGEQVQVHGHGTFFNSQKTVFLRCEGRIIDRVWDKPQFPDRHPHITLYDSDSRNTASDIAAVLNGYEWRGQLPIERLAVLRSTRGQLTLDLADAATPVLAAAFGHSWTLEEVAGIAPRQRREMLEVLIERLARTLHLREEYSPDTPAHPA